MIQLIVKLGKFLESRFPPKLLVLESDYRELKSRLNDLEKRYINVETAQDNIDALIKRISVVEQYAAHTEAVKVVIAELSRLKEDFTTIKTGLGLSRIQDVEVQALLNGVPISPEDNQNG